jgi:hypothetical protein
MILVTIFIVKEKKIQITNPTMARKVSAEEVAGLFDRVDIGRTNSALTGGHLLIIF